MVTARLPRFAAFPPEVGPAAARRPCGPFHDGPEIGACQLASPFRARTSILLSAPGASLRHNSLTKINGFGRCPAGGNSSPIRRYTVCYAMAEEELETWTPRITAQNECLALSSTHEVLGRNSTVLGGQDPSSIVSPSPQEDRSASAAGGRWLIGRFSTGCVRSRLIADDGHMMRLELQWENQWT
jgi:hypothetical protein